MKPVKIGVVRCSNISEVYLKVGRAFPVLEVAAVADIVPERAKAKAEAHSDQNRSLGVADMAYALRTGREHRANGRLTYHVLDIMHAFLDSSRERRHVRLQSTCERPEAMPMNLLARALSVPGIA